MTLYYARTEEDDDGNEVEVEYEVEVDYDPGRPAPAYNGSDATLCDPGDDEEFEITDVTRINADGSREDVGADYLDADRKSLLEMARDEYEPPERDDWEDR